MLHIRSMSHAPQSTKSGLPPGTLVHVGEARPDQPRITLTAYGPDSHRAAVLDGWSDVEASWGDEPVRWINVDGVHVPELVRQAGTRLGLHALHLEDVMNTRHRPTFAPLEDGGFVMILKMVGMNKKLKRLVVEQLTVAVQGNAVLSFQEQRGDVFDGLRERLAAGGGNTRGRGAEYLAYRLVDTVVDQSYFVTDHLMDSAEALEERILKNADAEGLQELQKLKKMLAQLRRATTPLREAVAQLLKDPPALVEAETRKHWHDVHDHLIQIHDHIDSLRDTLGGLMDLHANGVNQRTNQVMQLMTMVATIFIPLTFIAGVYGMNFDHIPELHWKYGYAMVWAAMVAVAGGMFVLFRRKGWI